MILTDEQLEIIKEPSKNIFIQACAGSGKTTVIVERFIHAVKNSKSRAGLAALSFTNVAVDRIHARCLSIGQNFLADYPNFIGTFDAFINRYIILPSSKNKRILVDSWENFYFEYKGRKIPLNFLIKDGNSTYKLNIPKDLKYSEIGRIVNTNLVAATQAAINKRKKLLEYGYLTSNDCRESASNLLIENSSIAINISNRFREIIVDEAQDCNDIDLSILESLRKHGTNIIVMADRNQGIFSFRNSNSTDLESFVKTHKPMLITGNWRSTKNICNFTANLKVDSNKADNSLIGSSSELPIYILKYKNPINKKLSSRFFLLCKENLLCPSKCTVLAYKRRDVFHAVGKSLSKHVFSNLYLYFNWKKTFNNQFSNNNDRLSVLRSMEKFLLSHMEIKHIDDLHVEDFCSQHNIDERWLRRVAFHVLINSPCLPTKSAKLPQWHKDTIEFFKKLSPHIKHKWKSFAVALKFTKSLTTKLEPDLEGFNYSTIHKAKGEEFDAALVVIPPSDANENNLLGFIKSEEQKRVYYVGATRAKKLLALGVPENLFGYVEKILKDNSINYVVIEI